MDMPVNFLPWRQTRRKATLRLWSMMFGGALVLISGVTLSRYAIGNIETRAEGVLLLAEQQLAVLYRRANHGFYNDNRCINRQNGGSRSLLQPATGSLRFTL